ncbi:MAG TPA: ABC transporter permease, partial [Bacillota bacterium]|nr:ABC transporter permease [Bacillota bacterium]
MNIMQRYALRSLKKNKTRTVVTIIGVILSAAMVSAVMVFTSSLLAQMEQSVISSVGDWHGMAEDVDETTYEAAIEDDDVEKF